MHLAALAASYNALFLISGRLARARRDFDGRYQCHYILAKHTTNVRIHVLSKLTN
jgi:hypothetical protein